MKFKIDDDVKIKDIQGAAQETGNEEKYFVGEFSIVDVLPDDDYPYCIMNDYFFALWVKEDEIELVQ